MATKYLVADCPSCGFPVSAHPGEIVTCPSCGISGKISGIEIPTPLFWLAIGLVSGVVISPYLRRQVARIK